MDLSFSNIAETPSGLNTLDVIPAYGRDYRTDQQVVAAWEAGKDFRIHSEEHPDNGRYVNMRDVKQYGITYIRVTFNKRRRSYLIRVD